jgi:hypothetical protein
MTTYGDLGTTPRIRVGQHDDLSSRSREVTVQLPAAAPPLTPGLVRVLARILTKASRTRGVSTIHEPDERDALAS